MVAILTVISILFAASQAAALTPLESIQRLVKRQSNIDIFPPACRSQCAAVFKTLTDCTFSAACICSLTNRNGIQTCINCSVDSSPSHELPAAIQSNLDTYNPECVGKGIPSLTVGGAVATGTSRSSGSSGSSKAGGAVGQVGLSMIGVVSAGVVGGIASLL